MLEGFGSRVEHRHLSCHLAACSWHTWGVNTNMVHTCSDSYSGRLASSPGACSFRRSEEIHAGAFAGPLLFRLLKGTSSTGLQPPSPPGVRTPSKKNSSIPEAGTHGSEDYSHPAWLPAVPEPGQDDGNDSVEAHQER